MSLISYVKTAMNKRLLISESHCDLNRCTPYRETWPTNHTHPTLSLRMVPDHTYLTRSMHSNLGRSHQQSWAGPLLEKKGLLTQSTTPWLTDPRVHTQVLSRAKQWSSGGKANLLLMVDYYAYRAHISSMRSVRSILARGGQPIGP
jgi:hypothetical protein